MTIRNQAALRLLATMPCSSAVETTSSGSDADDLLAPDKIERQLAALGKLTAGEHFSPRRGPRSTIGPEAPVSSKPRCAKIFLLSSGS